MTSYSLLAENSKAGIQNRALFQAAELEVQLEEDRVNKQKNLNYLKSRRDEQVKYYDDQINAEEIALTNPGVQLFADVYKQLRSWSECGINTPYTLASFTATNECKWNICAEKHGKVSDVYKNLLQHESKLTQLIDDGPLLGHSLTVKCEKRKCDLVLVKTSPKDWLI